MPELLRGKGASLGAFGTRFPIEQRTMLHVLDAQARERPDATWVVVDGAQRLTFGEAQAEAHRVAHAIVEDLGGPGHVGLFLRNQIEFLPSFYGVQSAGGVAVPLNADSRGLLLQRVIERADVRAIIARGDQLSVLQELDGLGAVELIVVTSPEAALPATVHGARVVEYREWISGRSSERVRELPDSSEIALIQFTSGTTGNSKGVLYPHHFLYLYSAAVSDAQGHTSDDVLTTPLPLFHVAALHIICNSALHAGCVAHLKSRFSARSYWQEIADDGATFGIILGTLAAILLRTGGEAPEHRLRALFCVPFPPGGEEFEQRFRVKLLWQGYGMTEVYPHPMPRELEPGQPYDTIGHAAAWVEYGAVDEHDRVLGPGVPGELVYRPTMPDAMTRGYYKDAEATTKAFRNFMFHTGDVGYVDEDGRVHFSGRSQDRIRRRGENISATELEFIAAQHEEVVECAAYGVPGELGEHEVKLDVYPRDTSFDVREYHRWLEGQLPRYMVPRFIEVFGAELPKTPSQKIQKFKLAEAGVDRPEVVEFEPARR
jgi:crotonobetaine/carnitine-CoA ligase